jgi:DNA-binding NarL/FixJ family response regulator
MDPPPDRTAPDGAGPQSREDALFRLLAQGHTDASAAVELGLSQRTVSTLVRGLMDRFAVENRFQLGLAIGIHLAARSGSPHGTDDAEPPLTA